MSIANDPQSNHVPLTNSVRLNGDFDVAQLQADLALAQSHFKSAPQVGKYHDGSWTGIALRNFSGDHGNTLAAHTGHSRDTAVLEKCHYFKSVLDSLGCPVYVARVLFLPPGKVIGEHTDPGFGWPLGMIRIHIPIVTDPRVQFHIGGESVYWRPGELWFGDFSKPHSLHNKSDITRVHLVLDCPITPATLALFPEPFLQQVRSESSILELNPVAVTAEQLAAYEGALVLKLPLLGMQLPVTADLVRDGKLLRLQLRGYPIPFHFSAVGEHQFQCNVVRLEWPQAPLAKPAPLLCRVLTNDQTYSTTLYQRLPVGVALFSWLQRGLLAGGWALYFGVLKLKRALTGRKHVTDQAT